MYDFSSNVKFMVFIFCLKIISLLFVVFWISFVASRRSQHGPKWDIPVNLKLSTLTLNKLASKVTKIEFHLVLSN